MNVEIYGAPWCSFCNQAKKICEVNSIEHTYYNLDDMADGKSVLEERMGQEVNTIPQIFIDGNHIESGITGLKEQIATFIEKKS